MSKTRTMNNGLEATVIGYDADGLIVQFENGQKVFNVQYERFANGSIRCPMLVKYIDDYAIITNVNTDPVSEFLVDANIAKLIRPDAWGVKNISKQKYWSINQSGFVHNGQCGLLHRFIMNATKGQRVIHLDGNKLDNRRKNLKVIADSGTAIENTRTIFESGIKVKSTRFIDDCMILNCGNVEFSIDIKDIRVTEKIGETICIVKRFFNLFPKNGEWLTARQISDYVNSKLSCAEQLKSRVVAYRISELGVINKKGHSNKTFYYVEKI